MEETEVILTVGWDTVTIWKKIAIWHLQALRFLDSELYPLLQAVGMTNVAQPEGVVSHVEITEKSKQSVHQFAMK